MSPNNTDKSWVWEQYDQTVMGDTIQKPGGDSSYLPFEKRHGHSPPIPTVNDDSWSTIGVAGARLGAMTAMPEMVAIFNGLGGAASGTVAAGEIVILLQSGAPVGGFVGIAIMITTLIGAVTRYCSFSRRSTFSFSSANALSISKIFLFTFEARLQFVFAWLYSFPT